MEVPVGEEAELQRRHRALDRHIHDVDDETAAIEARQVSGKRRRAFERVEGEDLLHPARAGESLGFLRDERRPGGDDEDVVGERGAVREVNGVRLHVDVFDGVLAVVDALAKLAAAGPHDVLRVGETERNEQEARLVHVAVVLIDDRDRDFVLGEGAPQPVRHERAARSGPEDDDAAAHELAPINVGGWLPTPDTSTGSPSPRRSGDPEWGAEGPLVVPALSRPRCGARPERGRL